MSTATAFADSSWRWISETRPFDVLPFVAVGTIFIETVMICWLGKVKKKLLATGVVIVSNLVSFVVPYLLEMANDVHPGMDASKNIIYFKNPVPKPGRNWFYIVEGVTINMAAGVPCNRVCRSPSFRKQEVHQMKTNKILGILCVVLLVIVIAGGVITVKQYREIQAGKINSLNTAFYYMQEILADGEQDHFADWDEKSSRLYLLIERADVSEDGMGDYQEVYDMIRSVSQLEDPAEAQSAELIAQARNMRVSWCTENGKWSADIVK